MADNKFKKWHNFKHVSNLKFNQYVTSISSHDTHKDIQFKQDREYKLKFGTLCFIYFDYAINIFKLPLLQTML